MDLASKHYKVTEGAIFSRGTILKNESSMSETPDPKPIHPETAPVPDSEMFSCP
jgi:hypothetical protein